MEDDDHEQQVHIHKIIYLCMNNVMNKDSPSTPHGGQNIFDQTWHFSSIP